mmetsp:Transcript_120202/g.336524  ORF Transcript_120202/g.336524 Transcript_120202/m.336524 type:complete len:524 (-) Transcript_120202:175-1746(-)
MEEERCCACASGVARVFRIGGRSLFFRRARTVHELVGDSMGVDLDQCHTLDLGELLLHKDSTRSFTKHYKMIAQLGKGGFGAVYKAESLLMGEVRAVKVMAKTRIAKEIASIATEIEVLIRLRHPNIISFYEFFEETQAICLVTELCEGGDFSKISKFPSQQIRTLYRDVFNGVAYLHENGVAHRDLKFENCLLVEAPHRKVGKVIDFGLAAIRREFDDEEWLDDKLGTKYFIAPEVIQKRTYGTKCDPWALGVMVFITLTGEHPFADKAFALPTKKLFDDILRHPLRAALLDKKQVEADARVLICGCLERIPEQRLDCHSSLEHRWLRPSSLAAELSPSNRGTVRTQQVATADARILSMTETSRFQKLLLLLSAHHAKASEVDDMRVAFMAQDTNGDGVLSLEEVKNGMRQSGVKLSDQEIEAKFRDLDSDSNGRIFYIEWLSATLDQSAIVSEGHMKEMFEFFDRDGSGLISRSELLSFLQGDEVDNLLQEGDTGKDGNIDFKEFKAICLALARQRQHSAK